MIKDYYTVKELALKIGKSESSVRRSIKNGKLSSIRIGDGENCSHRIPHSELERIGVVDLKKYFTDHIKSE